MYEFNKKEIRKKFKKTKYGKDTNRWLYISIFIAVIYFGVCTTLCVISSNLEIELNDLSKKLLVLLKFLTIITFMGMSYFDGKRDGAIEQYKKNKKDYAK